MTHIQAEMAPRSASTMGLENPKRLRIIVDAALSLFVSVQTHVLSDIKAASRHRLSLIQERSKQSVVVNLNITCEIVSIYVRPGSL